MLAQIKQAVEDARVRAGLREMAPRTRRLYDIIQGRMYKEQLSWGKDISVLTEETAKYSPSFRRCLAFEKAMMEIPIEIEDNDLLVGCSMRDGYIVKCVLPQYVRQDEYDECTRSMSHKCMDFPTLLEKGLSGIMADIRAKKAEIQSIENVSERAKKTEALDAMEREASAAVRMAHRYAALAEEKASRCTDEARKAELLKIAGVCRRVPEFPAETLHEAIQSVYFAEYILLETSISSSIGRIDQYLNPYFEKDFTQGRITLEEAQELIDGFYIRVNNRLHANTENSLTSAPRAKDIIELSHLKTMRIEMEDSVNHWGKNILISGLTRDRTDGTNAITYMCLNATEKLQLTSPVLSIRLHKNSPPELIERAAEVIKSGGGMPYVNNDDIIISAYEKLGVPFEDAVDYANSACWETMLQGKTFQEMIRGVNFLYLLELAINRGKSFVYADIAAGRPAPRYGDLATFPDNFVVDGVDTGAAERFTKFEEVMNAWKIQMDYMLKVTMEKVAKNVAAKNPQGKFSSAPLLSALMQDCVKNAEDICHGGARYYLWHLMGEAVSNAADAAAAIKQFVFTDKTMTLPELVEMMKNNWQSKDGEDLRLSLLNKAPKFGNDIDFVDDIAKEMVDYFLERVEYHSQGKPETVFCPSVGTFAWVLSIGERIGASADGRFSQEVIAANMSPAVGRDLSGVTAAIGSYMKLNLKTMAAGAPIDLRVNKKGLEGEEGTKRIAAILKTFIELEGNMITLTVTSADELRKAMAEPEKYRGLRVRMGGWSAYFTLLSKESQEMHLRRAEHELR